MTTPRLYTQALKTLDDEITSRTALLIAKTDERAAGHIQGLIAAREMLIADAARFDEGTMRPEKQEPPRQ